MCIITEDYKEVQDYILHQLNQGATLYVAQGAYDATHRMELVTVLCGAGISYADQLSQKHG